MRTTFFFAVPVTLLLAVMAPSAPAAELAVPGRTPANAHFIVSVPASGEAWSNVAETPLAAPLESAVAAAIGFGDPQEGTTRQMIESLEEDLGYSLALPSLMTQTLAGLDVYFLDQGGQPGYVANIAFNSPAAASRTFEQVRTEAAHARGVTRGISADTILESTTGQARMIELPAFEIFLALEDNVLTYGTQKRFVESAVANEGGVLFQSTYYHSFMEELRGEDADLWVFGEPIWLLDLVPRERILPVVRTFFEHPPPLGMKARADSEGLHCITFVPQGEMGAAQRRFTLAAPPAGRLAVLDFLPGNSEFLYATNSFDGVYLFESVLTHLEGQENDLPLSAEALSHAMETSIDLLGFDIETDLLANVGPDLAIGLWRNEQAAGDEPGLPDLVFVSNLRDPERVQDVLLILEEVIDNSLPPAAPAGQTGQGEAPPPPPLFTEETIEGQTVRIANPERLGNDETGLRPAYTVTRGSMFVLGFSEEALRLALRAGREEAPSIRQDDLYTTHAAVSGGEWNTHWFVRPPVVREYSFLFDFLPVELPGMIVDPPGMVDSFSLGGRYSPTGARREVLIHFVPE